MEFFLGICLSFVCTARNGVEKEYTWEVLHHGLELPVEFGGSGYNFLEGYEITWWRVMAIGSLNTPDTETLVLLFIATAKLNLWRGDRNMLQLLPTELVLAIATLLERKGDRLNLARCCKALYAILRPRLLSHISLAMINIFRTTGDWIKPPQELPIYRFCRIVLSQPSLSSFVQSLTLFNARGPERVTKRYEPFRVSLYAKTVESASHSEAARLQWMDSLKRNDEDAWLALLLVSLGNLQTLDMVLPEPGKWPHTSQLLRDAAFKNTPLTYLRSLHEVYLRPKPAHFQSSEALLLSRLLPFMGFPTVRLIHATRVCADLNSKIRGHSHVSSIRLTSSRILLPLLAPVIEMCDHLEEFRYTSAHRTRIRERTEILKTQDIFNPAPLFETFCKHKNTLRILSLTFEDDTARFLWQTPDFPTRHYLGDLSMFLVLEHLQIRLANLLNFYPGSWEPSCELLKSIPPSLHCLHIVDCHTEALPYLLPCLSEIAKARSHLIPNLHKLVLRPPAHEGPPEHEDYWTRWYDPQLYTSAAIPERYASLLADLLELMNRFREVGVEFCVVDRFERADLP